MFKLMSKWEDIDTVDVPASTAVKLGDELAYNGSGQAIPAVAGDIVIGHSLVAIARTDPDYASAKKIPYQKVGAAGQLRFQVPVTKGATPTVGKNYDVDAAGSLDCSKEGTQFTVTEILVETANGAVTPGLVEVTLAQVVLPEA